MGAKSDEEKNLELCRLLGWKADWCQELGGLVTPPDVGVFKGCQMKPVGGSLEDTMAELPNYYRGDHSIHQLMEEMRARGFRTCVHDAPGDAFKVGETEYVAWVFEEGDFNDEGILAIHASDIGYASERTPQLALAEACRQALLDVKAIGGASKV